MRAIAGLWRWRHNPLRRKTDLLEAWVSLATAVLIAVAAPVAGVLTGTLSENALLRTVHQQQQERHEVTATVMRTIRQSPPDPDPETVPARDARSQVIAGWRAPDGTRHHGTVTTVLQTPHRGEKFTIWTDVHGTVVARPLDRISAMTHAILAGIGASAVLAVSLDGVRRLVMWRIVRRRYARWDRAWEKTGPDWGRTGADS
ncbi:Rv1733c family protein [Streptomyces odontomachi]|uniref:Rv1733c family protein n=1 Tax=Streptomyces odontomachi TaxID=2944940 RepID=UPI00210E7720|nr:hypothetical protein [Streptomyces sp. ODS25]